MISVNFASREYRGQYRFLQALLVMSALCIVGMVVIVSFSLMLRRERDTLDRSVKEIQAAEERIKPLLLERDRVVKDLNGMTGLLQARSFSWTQLLTNLEHAVPVGVALHKVEFDPKERAVSLNGAAQSPESLRNLMVELERTKGFQDVRLKNQSIEKGTISFNVVALYSGSQAGNVASGK